jgi:hypothetical protein
VLTMDESVRSRPWVKIMLIALPVWLVISAAFGLFVYLREETSETPRFQIQSEVEAASLLDDLRKIAVVLGERNFRTDATRGNLRATAKMIEGALGPQNTGFKVNRNIDEQAHAQQWMTLWVEVPGTVAAGEVVWLFAGYDSGLESPGVEANGTGVAGLLALARSLSKATPERTIRIAFVPHANQLDYDATEAARQLNKTIVNAGGTVVQVVHVHALGLGPDLAVAAPAGQPLAKKSGTLATLAGAPSSPSTLPGLLAGWNLPVGEVTSVATTSAPRVADFPDPQEFTTAVQKLRALVVSLATR